jgi:hypothetical protein
VILRYNAVGIQAWQEVFLKVEGVATMTRVVLDAATLAKLPADDVVEIANEGGHVFGYFVPQLDLRTVKNEEPKISEEEIQRRLRKGGGRELSAILAELENRA